MRPTCTSLLWGLAGILFLALAGPLRAQSPTTSTLPSEQETRAAAGRIRAFIGSEMFGPGAFEVLTVAEEALIEKHAAGEASLVRLEDLWAHALQEGLVLFNNPEKRWGRTTAEETSDMIGQTTIGPWQMTVTNIRTTYGPRYGVDQAWMNTEIYDFVRGYPEIQAKMIADYIQLSYEKFGVRSPYAIQRYFWLEPYVRGEIGQAEDWTKSPVAKPGPGQTWKDLTAADKADTGFYAKQVLLGTHYTKSGLLFWLLVTGNEDAAREAIRTWRDHRRVVLDPRNGYVTTEVPGGFALSPEDVRFADGHPEIRERLRALIREENAAALEER
ncbi:MAG: hypothetical protein RLY93_11220 [Sumerlaeia bacterium]